MPCLFLIFFFGRTIAKHFWFHPLLSEGAGSDLAGFFYQVQNKRPLPDSFLKTAQVNKWHFLTRAFFVRKQSVLAFL